MKPWRTGRKLGRTLYVQDGERPGYDDTFIGIMETPELAEKVCRVINASKGLTELTEVTPSFTCPDCKMVSYNPNDIENRYCGNCHAFVDDFLRDVNPDDPGGPVMPVNCQD